MLKGKRFGRRYPWADWFGRGSFTLIRGKDYTISTHGMVQMIRNVACSERFRLKVTATISYDLGRLGRDEITVKVLGSLDG